jgi:hypothetical protein
MDMGDRVKRGDVEAVFEAFGNGGWAVLRHSKAAHGAPADELGSHGAIRPFQPWDGRHLCAEDWHVILIADIEGGDTSFSEHDAKEIMSTITVTFTLDGAVLTTKRTAIKRFLNPELFGLEEAYYFQEGRIMSPDDLTVGQHQLNCRMTAAGVVVFDGGIQFTVDPAGGTACL